MKRAGPAAEKTREHCGRSWGETWVPRRDRGGGNGKSYRDVRVIEVKNNRART